MRTGWRNVIDTTTWYRYEYEYEYDDQIVCAEVEKSLFEKKIEKKEGKAYNKQGASKRPNVEV